MNIIFRLYRGRTGSAGAPRQSPIARRTVCAAAAAVLPAIAAVSSAAAPASAESSITVAYTGVGIYPRTDPSMSAEKVGTAVADGVAVPVVCEVEAEPVSNGYETIAIWDRLADGTWLPNSFLATGASGWTLGVPQCGAYDSEAAYENPEVPRSEPTFADPCMAMWPGGDITESEVFGGSVTDYDAEQSQYQVCMGFGSDTSIEYSTGMKCAVIAAAVTASGVTAAGQNASLACDAVAFDEEGLSALPGRRLRHSGRLRCNRKWRSRRGRQRR